MGKNSVLEKVLDILGEILAVLTVVLYAVLIINANWTFIPAGLFFDILLVVKNYAALGVVLIVISLVLLAGVILFFTFTGKKGNKAPKNHF